MIQPSNLRSSLRFNPLASFRGSPRTQATRDHLGNNGTGSDSFWRVSATNILHVCLSAIVGTGDSKITNLGNVRGLINHLGIETD